MQFFPTMAVPRLDRHEIAVFTFDLRHISASQNNNGQTLSKSFVAFQGPVTLSLSKKAGHLSIDANPNAKFGGTTLRSRAFD
jgi:hypothetical protein